MLLFYQNKILFIFRMNFRIKKLHTSAREYYYCVLFFPMVNALCSHFKAAVRKLFVPFRSLGLPLPFPQS